MDVGIIVIAILAAALLAFLTIRKVRYGSACCGEVPRAEKRIEARDKNRSHYPFSYVAEIEGMICANCARRVENAFHARDDLLAKVDFEKKQVKIFSKVPLSREEAIKCLQGTPYTLISFEE